MRYLALFGVVVFGSACSLGLEVPEGTAIACNATAECPESFVCQTSLSRCVPLGFDITAPELFSPPAISPAAVGIDAVVTIEFSSTKRLGIDPEVTIIFGGSITRTARLDRKNEEQTAFVYTYTPDLTEPETFASVFIRITDVVGNQGVSETPLALRFDRTPPDIFLQTVRMTITPAEENRVVVPEGTALGNNGHIVVEFQASELLSPDSTVSADDLNLTFAQSGALGQIYTYAATLDPAAGATDGPRTLRLEAVDEALNHASFELTTLTVDTAPPAQAAVNTADAIIYHRAPWSNTNAGPRFSLRAVAGSLEPNANIAVFADSVLLAKGRATTDGALDLLPLPDIDHGQVAVKVVDDAGNGLAQVAVREVEWVAQIDANASASPHRALTVTRIGRELIQQEARSLLPEELRRLGSIGDDASSWLEVGLSRPWRERGSSDHPGERFGHAATFDSRRGIMLVFGGTTDPYAFYPLDEQWAYNGDTWTLFNPQTRTPPGRFGAKMAYDSARDRVVLYGGFSRGKVVADTWEWDGAVWREVLTVSPPGNRGFHDMAYDPGMERVVLYGGCSNDACTTFKNDTWAWDGTTWVDISTTTRPTARVGHTMTYYNGAIVLYGGCSAGEFSLTTPENIDCGSAARFLSDRWRLGSTGWVNISDGTEPPARAFHAAAWDTGDVMFIAGGVITPSEPDDAVTIVYATDGSDFFPAFTESNQTLQRLASMVYDSAAGTFLYFGGIHPEDMGPVVTSLTHVVDYGGLHPVSDDGGASVRPDGRSAAGFTFVSARGGLVLSGGYDGTITTAAWRGSYWESMFNSPSNAGQSAFDSQRQRLVQLTTTQTWELGNTGLWATNAATLGNRDGYGMAYDNSAKRILVFGGGVPPTGASATMSLFSGTAWTSTPCVGAGCPPARRCASIAYDVARNRTVLFGGYVPPGGSGNGCDDFLDDAAGGTNDTWEWNGSAWTAKTSTATPPRRTRSLLVYDSGRARVVLVGQSYQDVWEWDGTNWRDVTPTGIVPPTRRGSQLGYDPSRAVIGLYAGRFINDYWELDVSPDQRPAVLVDFDWNTSGASRHAVKSVTVHARAGGRGATTDVTLGGDNDVIGEVRTGAHIEYWRDGVGWTAGPANTADINAPSDLSNNAGGDCGAPFLYSADGHIYARIAPATGSGNGADDGRITVDFAEATVRYTIGADLCP